MNIGKELSSARHKLGLELKDIEEAIKIRTRFIEAMENNKFEILPEPVYVKGFIRSYAKYLKIDDTPLVETYKKTEPTDQTTIIPTKEAQDSFAFIPKDKVKGRRFTLPAAMMFLIFFMTLFLTYLGYQDSLQSQRLSDKKYVDKQLKTLEKPKARKRSSRAKNKIYSNTRLFKIKIETTRGTWVRLKAKNKTFFYNYLSRDKKYSFISREPVEITAGRGSYVKIFQDGRYKGTLSKNPTIATKVFRKKRIANGK